MTISYSFDRFLYFSLCLRVYLNLPFLLLLNLCYCRRSYRLCLSQTLLLFSGRTLQGEGLDLLPSEVGVLATEVTVGGRAAEERSCRVRGFRVLQIGWERASPKVLHKGLGLVTCVANHIIRTHVHKHIPVGPGFIDANDSRHKIDRIP